MKLPKYCYQISDKKYEARIDLFKYLIWAYTALIAASLIGFEKAVALEPAKKLNLQSVSNLKISVVLLVLAIIQALLVLALSYHHKYFNKIYLEQHCTKIGQIRRRWKRIFFSCYVYLEHIRMVIETIVLVILAATWYILPIVSLCYLAKAYQGILP